MKRLLYTIFCFIIAIQSFSQTLSLSDGALLSDGEALRRIGMTLSNEILEQMPDTIAMGLDTLEKYNLRFVRVKIDENTPQAKLDTLLYMLYQRRFTLALALSDSIDALAQLKTIAERQNTQTQVAYQEEKAIAMWQIPINAPSAAEAINRIKQFKTQPLIALEVDSKGMEKLEKEVMKVNPDAIVLDVDPLKEQWVTFENERKALPSIFLKITSMIDVASRVAADNNIPLIINLEGFPRDNGFRQPESKYYSRLGLWNFLKSKLDDTPQLWAVIMGQWTGAGACTDQTSTNVIYASDEELLQQMTQ